MENIELITKTDSLVVGFISDEKFKTNQISLFFEREIDRDEVTKLALLYNVMGKGTINYPTHTEMAKREEELYGLSFSGGTFKKGNRLVIQFSTNFISDTYLEESILDDVVEYMEENLNNPLIKYSKLDGDIFELEKINLKNEIEAKINDKIGYAQNRCVELMFENHPFSISEDGYIEEIDSITQDDLAKMYSKLMNESKVYVIFTGDFKKKKVEDILKAHFKFEDRDVIKFTDADIPTLREDLNIVSEDMGITQGKLVIGYRNGIDRKDIKRRLAYMVANSILGGGAHSLLFNNVREKESMCYYVSSQPDKYMGITLIQAGIEIESYDKALELIRAEVDKMRRGEFSQEDIDTAKKSIVNMRKTISDSIHSRAILDFDRLSDGNTFDFDEETQLITEVSKEEIVESFQGMVEDTVYFLR